MVMSVRFMQQLKANSPIEVTKFEIFILVNFVPAGQRINFVLSLLYTSLKSIIFTIYINIYTFKTCTTIKNSISNRSNRT